jgi:drug/metabolite transporter superfamily protein YnfA
VQTVSLSWQHCGEVAVGLTLVGSALALAPDRRWRTVGAFARETAVIAVLYAVWQLAGAISVTGTGEAFARARWIERTEHDLHLPSERDVQHLVVGHSWLTQGANLYYAAMHLTTMGAFLVWLFWRHRDQYRPIRQVMAWTTLGCLLVQLAPVAPPRMMPGFVDTGLRFNESVYSNGLPIDQLSAMPSVHVAWAVCIGYYVWRVSPSRWRWIGPAHAVIMVLVVVATANHWWADGIVAVAILCCCAWGVHGARTAWHAVLVTSGRRRRRDDVVPDSDAAVPSGAARS